jgi:hypothetical protein
MGEVIKYKRYNMTNKWIKMHRERAVVFGCCEGGRQAVKMATFLVDLAVRLKN